MYQPKNHGEFRETWELCMRLHGKWTGNWHVSAFLYMILLASGTTLGQMSIKLGIQKLS